MDQRERERAVGRASKCACVCARERQRESERRGEGVSEIGREECEATEAAAGLCAQRPAGESELKGSVWQPPVNEGGTTAEKESERDRHGRRERQEDADRDKVRMLQPTAKTATVHI